MTREEWDNLQNSFKKEYRYLPTGVPGEVKMVESINDDKKPKKNKTLNIVDNRAKDIVSGITLTDKNRLTANGVPLEYIQGIIDEAKKNNIDPYTALAISFQETGLGTRGNMTKTGIATYHLNPDVYGTNATNDPKLGIKSIVDQFKVASSLQKRGIIPSDDINTIQSYAGYGSIKKGHADLEGSKKIYGLEIPEEGFDMKKNPMYGKRVVDIRDNILKKNTDIINLINAQNK